MGRESLRAGSRSIAIGHKLYSVKAITSDPAELVRGLRQEAGLTQRQLAGRMGTTQSSIAALERTGSNPTVATVRAALDALGHELRLGAEPKQRNVDESLIRRQLELTPEERLRQLEAMAAQARELMAAGARARGELD
jgi:transcriptional regulator with XRE-family HTH domain